MQTKTLAQSRPRVGAGTTVTERCAEARELISAGDYEAACEVLGKFWLGVGERPRLQGLSAEEQAELLLRAGALSSWLGSASQVPGAQGAAKDLISESIRTFESLRNTEKIAEAQSDIALCYWREGALDEARVWFREARSKAKDPVNRLRILVRSTTVEFSSNRFNDVLGLLDEAAPLLDQVDDLVAHGCYHMQRALALRRIGGPDSLDRALIESTAASVHFEQANHYRHFARCENNTGSILRFLGRYEEALEHLERARRTAIELDDVGMTAQVNETRARVLIAQQRYAEAEKISHSTVKTLEEGGEQLLLAEALEGQGVAMARLGRYQASLGVFKRAADVANTAGDPEFAGRLMLTTIEELKSFLTSHDISSFYREADSLLGDEISSETVSRLRSCARLVAANGADSKPMSSTQINFQDEVLKCESELIRRALDDANGSVTRAAKILGLTHQGLCYIINHRHKTLLAARAPIRVRRKSLIKKRQA